jgi:hypothetical protein
MHPPEARDISQTGELSMNAETARYSARLQLLIVMLTLMSPCDGLWSAQTDPFVGNWRSRNGGELRFVVENGRLRMDGKIILRDGNSRTVAVIYQFDGQEHPTEVAGERKHSKHTTLQKRIDDHTIESRTNHDDGKEYSTERYVISADGSELTITQLGQRSDGTPSETVNVFVRQ